MFPDKWIYLLLLLLLNIICLRSDSSEVKDLNENSDEKEIVEVKDPPVELIDYKTPRLSKQKVFLYEPFDDRDLSENIWIKSIATKDNSEAKYDGVWDIVSTSKRIKGDKGLRMNSKAKHHAISRRLDRVFKFNGDNLVVQYDVQFRNGQECGGAYLKLLTAPTGNLSYITDLTPYSIMFGPDKCGNEYKLHFIFKHRNNNDGNIREIHWRKANAVPHLNDVFTDNKWHIFRLTVRPDNSFEVQMDKRSVGKGSLLEDFEPPVNPPKEIDDITDVKPDDWDDREKVPDPEASKPVDWDETAPRKIPDKKAKKPDDWLEEESVMIPDPKAIKPQDWSEEIDGEWEPPLINNPKCESVSGCGPWTPPLVNNPDYKGKWKPPLINNPNYQGKWAPRKIPNPNYFEDVHPYKMQPFDSVAFELWTISDNIVFDNILITNDVDIANNVADATYQLKRELDDQLTDNWFISLVKSTNRRPWLWALYVIALAIPVILFIGYCCVSPGKKEAKSIIDVEDKDINEKAVEKGSSDIIEDNVEFANFEEIGEIAEEEDEESEKKNQMSERSENEEKDNEENEVSEVEVMDRENKPRMRKMRVRKE